MEFRYWNADARDAVPFTVQHIRACAQSKLCFVSRPSNGFTAVGDTIWNLQHHCYANRPEDIHLFRVKFEGLWLLVTIIPRRDMGLLELAAQAAGAELEPYLPRKLLKFLPIMPSTLYSLRSKNEEECVEIGT